MNTYIYIGIAIIIALLSTRLMKLIKLPNVTGYLLTGILVGPYVLGLFSMDLNSIAQILLLHILDK